MKIAIDNRELKLIKCLENMNDLPFIEYRSLDIGDIHICDNSNNIIIIIERKTISDLLSSIKDGRYSEQSARLNECSTHNHNIYYLIEGIIPKNQNMSLVHSTFCSLSYIKGFSLLRTFSIDETVKLILQFCKKLDKNTNGSFYDTNIDKKKDYCSSIKIKKKDNITPNNILQIFLMQIPDISDKTAKAIVEQYDNIRDLLNIINNDTDKLYDIQVSNEKSSKSRKISKKCVKNLITYLG